MDTRVCSECGGLVEVLDVPRTEPRGKVVHTEMGACGQCGRWFTQAHLGELPIPTPERAEQLLHY